MCGSCQPIKRYSNDSLQRVLHTANAKLVLVLSADRIYCIVPRRREFIAARGSLSLTFTQFVSPGPVDEERRAARDGSPLPDVYNVYSMYTLTIRDERRSGVARASSQSRRAPSAKRVRSARDRQSIKCCSRPSSRGAARSCDDGAKRTTRRRSTRFTDTSRTPRTVTRAFGAIRGGYSERTEADSTRLARRFDAYTREIPLEYSECYTRLPPTRVHAPGVPSAYKHALTLCASIIVVLRVV